MLMPNLSVVCYIFDEPIVSATVTEGGQKSIATMRKVWLNMKIYDCVKKYNCHTFVGESIQQSNLITTSSTFAKHT
jgi:hypothetical protein